MRRRHNLPIHNSTSTTTANKNASRTTKTSNRVLNLMSQFYSKRSTTKILFLFCGLLLIVFRLGMYYGSSRRTSTKTTVTNHRLLLPPVRTDLERLQHVEQTIVQNREKYIPIQQPSDTYHVFHCPPLPPPDYPREYPIMDMLEQWPIDDVTDTERTIHQGLCVFDFGSAVNNLTAQVALQHQIRTYQRAEVPFIIRNDDKVLRTAERWNHGDYMDQLLSSKIYRGEISPTNHMMYWNINSKWTKVPEDFKRPTEMHPFTFAEWKKLANSGAAFNEEHAYIRMDACEEGRPCDSSYRRNGMAGTKYATTQIDNADFWFDEMPFFDPNRPDESELYVMAAQKQYHRGIQCRFGMAGLIAENHFDSDRNFIAVLGGERRYILGHPKNCPNMYLYPMHHPMERHSHIDWSSPDLEKFPNFPSTTVNEVVLQAGDVLYLPTHWFHHIVSLNLNYQCNARSGSTTTYQKLIQECGFKYKLYL
mmetsp:Transcript_24431/g.36255  ORF Transcript_24431/g.36255 Transcript_24431/m.36255 type:complete len:477 (+) Transcript_24431:177-1607(+)